MDRLYYRCCVCVEGDVHSIVFSVNNTHSVKPTLSLSNPPFSFHLLPIPSLLFFALAQKKMPINLWYGVCQMWKWLTPYREGVDIPVCDTRQCTPTAANILTIIFSCLPRFVCLPSNDWLCLFVARKTRIVSCLLTTVLAWGGLTSPGTASW